MIRDLLTAEALCLLNLGDKGLLLGNVVSSLFLLLVYLVSFFDELAYELAVLRDDIPERLFLELVALDVMETAKICDSVLVVL